MRISTLLAALCWAMSMWVPGGVCVCVCVFASFSLLCASYQFECVCVGVCMSVALRVCPFEPKIFLHKLQVSYKFISAWTLRVCCLF